MIPCKKTLCQLGFTVLTIFLFYSCENGIFNFNYETPAGERILFIKQDGTLSQICSIKPNGTDLQTIASHDMAGEFVRQGYIEAKWSPDKSHLAISGGPSESLIYIPLWLMDNQGTLIKRITPIGYSPNWSNDGNEILFTRLTGPQTVIIDYYITNINTLEERLVLKGEIYEWANADWSHDEKYILTQERYYWINDDGKSEVSDQEIVLLQLSNGEKRQLTDTEVMDAGPHWSPDDSKIVYITGKWGYGYQINLMDRDGSNKTTIVDSTALYTSLCWSPSGDRIAFNMSEKLEGSAKYAKDSDIYIYDIYSGGVTRLTNFAADSIKVTVQDWK